MSLLQVHELKSSEFTEEQLSILKRLPLSISFLTRADIHKKAMQGESYRQGIGLLTVVGAFIMLGHLCSNDIQSGGSLWLIYLILFGSLYLFITKIVWNNSVKEVLRRLTDEEVSKELEKARIFLNNNPFCYRDGPFFYENLPKYWRFITLQEQAQSDFRHIQARVNAYKKSARGSA